MQKKNKHLFKLLIGLIIAAITIWLTFRSTDWDALKAAFNHVRWEYIILVLPALALSYVFRIYRWVLLLAPVKKITKKSVTTPLLTGFLLNSILPGRLGEFARSALLSKKESIPFASSFATVVIARLFDGLALTALALIVMTAMWNSLSDTVRTGLILAGCVYIVILFILIALRKWHEKTAEIIVYPLKKFHFQKAAQKIKALLLDFASGLDILTNIPALIKTATLSALVWGCLILSVLPAFFALGIPIQWYYAPLVLVLAGFGMMIPTPAGAGTVHYAIGVLFPIITGIGEPEAKVLAIVFHATQFIPVILAGLAVSKGNLDFDEK